MDQDRQRRRDELFELLLDLDPTERAERLAAVGAEDPDLRAELEHLLSLDQRMDTGFLESSPVIAGTSVLAAGTNLGRYVIERLIGTGGMSSVYLAHDPMMDRRIAIKVLAAVPHDQAWRDRFFAELKILGSIQHDHVVRVYDFGETPAGLLYLVMEYLEGEDLATAIANGHCGDVARRIDIARQIAVALRDLHAAGVVHRDLKPANVMLDRSGDAKLIDFGIAKTEGTRSVTQSGLTRGTPEYMSPERIQGAEATPLVDVYSYGVLLFELFSGRRPFAGHTDQVLDRALHEPVPADALRGLAPGYIVGLVRAATAKDPRERPQTMDTVVTSLERHTAWPRWIVFARAPVIVLAMVVTAAMGGVVIYWNGSRFSTSNAAADSVAVLPFDVVAQDPDAEYVADGLVESVTNALARMTAIRVVARATAFEYRGRTGDVQAIGRALNVRTVVTGKVSRSREQFRVQAELVDAGSGLHIWGQQYEGTEDDLLRFHDDLALRIRQHLRSDARAATPEVPWRATVNPAAFRLYLRGRHALARLTVGDTQRGIDFFNQALALDPVYAAAYSGLADSYFALSGNFLLPKDAMAKAKAAAEQAIALDPALPEAYVSLGIVEGFYDFDWKESADAIRRAIALQPGNSSSHLWYAWNLMVTGRPDEAIAEMQRAHDLDPLSLYVEVGLAQMYYYAGQPETAAKRLQDTLRSTPDFFNGRYYLGVAYLQVDRFPDAIRELESARRLDAQQPQPLGYLAYAYARNGDAHLAHERLEELTRLAATRYVSGYLFALAAVGLGSDQEAIRWLRRAYDDRDDMLSILGLDKPFAGLRSNPRVQALLSEIGLLPAR